MKHNVIQKLTYKVKFISQINGGLSFHVFWKFDTKIFLDSIVNSMERINTKKRNTIAIVQCSVLR